MGSHSQIANVVENENAIHIAVKKPSTRYMDEFVNLKCAPDLLLSGVYPNAKEITEACSAYNAVRTHLRQDFVLGDESVGLLAVADGSTPRVAAMFAYRSRWHCWSVDPQMQDKQSSLNKWSAIRNLSTHRQRIEDFCGSWEKPAKLVVTAIHSHVGLPQICASIGDHPDVAIIACHCCKPLELPAPVAQNYHDWGMWSPQREIKIYKGAIRNGLFESG